MTLPKRYLNQPFCKLSSGCECECFSGQRFCGKYAPLIVTDSFCVICFATTHFWKDYIVSVYDYHGPSDWFILIISNDRKHLHHFHLFLDSKGCWGTTDDFTTSFLDFSVFHCSQLLGEPQACPFLVVIFPPLLLSALFSSPFHCAL